MILVLLLIPVMLVMMVTLVLLVACIFCFLLEGKLFLHKTMYDGVMCDYVSDYHFYHHNFILY